MIRFGLVGFGAWGRHHAQAITETPGVELAAILAHSPASQAEARTLYPHSSIYAELSSLLARSDIDVVDVVLPSHLHLPFGMEVLGAGKHLLLEKPMALSEADCDALISLSRKKGLALAIGHELRLSSLWGKVKSMIDEGAIGQPLYVLIELWRNPYRHGSGGWRYDIGRVGNWILEEPIHFFDLARWYLSSLGEPVSVFARANARRAENPELTDNFSAIVNFPRGAYAVISQTLGGFEHHQVAKVVGARGALWASWSGAMDRTFHPTFSLKYFNGEAVSTVEVDRPTGEVYELRAEISMMAKAIRGDGAVCVGGEDGKWSVKMCLRARESVESGCLVQFN